mgnify:CR=1 FL=1
MNFNEIILKQQIILRDIFDDESLLITAETSAQDIDDWDSLTHMQIIARMEKEFKVRFALGELQSLKNVGDMANLILQKI